MDLGPEPLRASADRVDLRHTLSSCRAGNPRGTRRPPLADLGGIRNWLGCRPAHESGDRPAASCLPGLARVATPQERRHLEGPDWNCCVDLRAWHSSMDSKKLCGPRAPCAGQIQFRPGILDRKSVV